MNIASDFFYSLFISLASGILLLAIQKWFSHANTPSKQTYSLNLQSLDKTRKQFMISLVLLILSNIACIKTTHLFLRSTFAIIIGFSVIILWGAFEAVFFPLYEITKKHSEKKTDKSGDNVQ